jgi:hypothetical protein
MKDLFLDLEKFRLGYYALEDTTKAPLGSMRIMKNCQITDRGGIAPRPGTEILGTYATSNFATKGFYNFRRSFGSDEVLIKTYDTYMEAYSKNNTAADWFKVKSTFTSDKEFGFITSLVNTEKNDYAIFNNRYDEYQRWSGAITTLNGALVGAETDVTVDSILTNETFYSGTATANAATTVDVAGTPWAASQWIGFYVYFPSTGKIRQITANTTSQLTFSTLGAGPGNIAFEIRQLAFPLTGTIIYAGTTIAYTTIDVYNKFPVSSAHAAADGTAVTLVPDTYPANPRGNRLTNYLNRIIVGNVRSAMARDTGGALQAYSSAGSYFVSKVNTPTDFTFSATRVAGEGDIVGTPYGGGDITDVQHQEEQAYIFKENYIESVAYSQDANDLAVRTPLKQNVGSVGPTIKGSDDIYFITEDKKFTSIGRVRAKDLKPQTENIGYNIKRFLDLCDFSTLGRGIEHKDRIYIPLKSDSTQTFNNVVLVYNKITNGFEGIWDIPAFALERWNDGLYYAESNGINVYKMLTGFADVVGDTRYPIVSECATHFFNLTAQKTGSQAINGLMIEGYIRGGTTINYKMWKDFSSEPFLTFTFSSTEEGLLDGESSSAFLGNQPLAINPMSATFSEPDNDGRRHFQFQVYFPFQYGNFFSFGQGSNGADFDYETTRIGLLMKEDFSPDNTKVKQI